MSVFFICPLAFLCVIFKAHIPLLYIATLCRQNCCHHHLIRYVKASLTPHPLCHEVYYKVAPLKKYLLNSIPWSTALQLQPFLKVTSHIPTILIFLSSVPSLVQRVESLQGCRLRSWRKSKS